MTTKLSNVVHNLPFLSTNLGSVQMKSFLAHSNHLTMIQFGMNCFDSILVDDFVVKDEHIVMYCYLRASHLQGGGWGGLHSLLEPGTTCVHDPEINTPNIQDFSPFKIVCTICS